MKTEKHCNMCGHCCRVIVNIIPMSEESVTWAKARGYKCLDSSEKHLAIEIPSVCPQLDKDNKCLLEGDDKPVTCQQYPTFLKYQELDRMGLHRNRLIGKGCGFASK